MRTSQTRRRLFQTAIVGCVALWASHATTQTTLTSTSGNAMQLTQDWDKVFPKSDKVDHQKVTFKNRYGITLAGDLYLPKDRGSRRLPAHCRRRPVRRREGAVVGSLCADHGGARLRHAGVRSVLYRGKRRRAAQCRLARHQHRGLQRGSGFPRPAAFVDRERIGIIGICGWGGMALNAVAVDKRVKAVVASTMYDMTRVMSKGYNDSVTLEQRTQTLEQLSRQRWTGCGEGNPGLPARHTTS